MVIKFIICGNQNNGEGNAIPKIKKTRNSYWTPEAQRYAAWKRYVQKAFVKKIVEATGMEYALMRDAGSDRVLGDIDINREKPIEITEGKARMDLKIYWADGKHADPENVFGSIADALFENDKNLDGSFEAQIAEDGKGRVEATIKII